MTDDYLGVQQQASRRPGCYLLIISKLRLSEFIRHVRTDHDVTDPVMCARCGSDVSFLLREFLDILLPYVTRMVNSSLRDAQVPDSRKHAIVTVLLKRRGLDTMDMANYTPVSSVTLGSKVIDI